MSGNPPGAADLQRLYRDAIRQHSADPVGYRRDIGATHRHEEYNPQCGDRIEVLLRVRDRAVAAVAFDGEACAICRASASLLCSLVAGRTVRAVSRLGEQLRQALSRPEGEQDPEQPPLHEELRPLLGVRPYPSRVQCALLPWKAAARALEGDHAVE